MLTVPLSTVRDAYAATEEKESRFQSIPVCEKLVQQRRGYFNDNGDYQFFDKPFEHDDYLLWC